VELTGDGSLDLKVSPAHAELTLHPLVEQGIALVDGPGEPLGRGDVHLERLPMGSYVIAATAEGHEGVRYPVCIDRGKRWTGVLRLPSAEAVPSGLVFIPGATTWQGGDELARLPRPLREVTVASLLLDRHLVTFGEYCRFLDDLPDPDQKELLPRVASVDRPLCSRIDSERFVPLAGIEMTPHFASEYGASRIPDIPVFGVDLYCVDAFAAWRSRRDGVRYRLPSAPEWELAARGSDRRIYPWGNAWDTAACHSKESFRDEPDLAPIGNFETDVGPHGVKGLAGELVEWTSSWYSEPARLSELRGGAWNLGERAARAAGRASGNEDERAGNIGFRLALDEPLR
jgi:formylglycine-generating enzyme required for sulfatase activity